MAAPAIPRPTGAVRLAGAGARPGRRRRVPAELAVLLAVAAVLAVTWSLVTPVLTGPDEDQHITYVQRLVEDGELPQRSTPGAQLFSTELELARRFNRSYPVPLNPGAMPGGSDAEERAFAEAERTLPEGARGDGTGPLPAYQNPPLYYLYLSAAYAVGHPADFFTRVHLMRLANLPFVLVVVAAAWLLAAELLPRVRWARVLAAALVAVHPQLGFMAGVVNPDIALAAVWSAFLVAAVRFVRRGPTPRRALGLGLLCAASALVHPRGLGIVVPAAVAVALALWRARPARGTAVRVAGGVLGPALLGLVGYVIVTTVVSGAGSSSQVAVQFSGAFNVRELLVTTWQFYLPPLRFMTTPPPPVGFRYVFVESFFAVFGALDVFLPAWVYPRLWSAALYGLVVLAVMAILRGGALRRHWRELVVLLSALAAFMAVLHVAQYRALLGNGGVDGVLVGRYLLGLLPLYGLAVAFVATGLPGRWGRGAGLVLLAFAVLLAIAGLGEGVLRWYA